MASPVTAQQAASQSVSSSRPKTQKCNSKKQLERVMTLVAIVAVIFAQCVIVPTVSARYLPTRSNNDQLRRQEIKEILRLLLDLPNEDQHESAWSGGIGGRAMPDTMYELSPVRAVRHPEISVNTLDNEPRAKRDTLQAKSSKVPF